MSSSAARGGFGAADEVKTTPHSPTKGTPLIPPSSWDCCDGQISAACGTTNLEDLLFPFCRSSIPQSRPRVYTRICRPRTKLGQTRPALLWCWCSSAAIVFSLRAPKASQRQAQARPSPSLPLYQERRDGFGPTSQSPAGWGNGTQPKGDAD